MMIGWWCIPIYPHTHLSEGKLCCRKAASSFSRLALASVLSEPAGDPNHERRRECDARWPEVRSEDMLLELNRALMRSLGEWRVEGAGRGRAGIWKV